MHSRNSSPVSPVSIYNNWWRWKWNLSAFSLWFERTTIGSRWKIEYQRDWMCLITLYYMIPVTKQDGICNLRWPTLTPAPRHSLRSLSTKGPPAVLISLRLFLPFSAVKRENCEEEKTNSRPSRSWVRHQDGFVCWSHWSLNVNVVFSKMVSTDPEDQLKVNNYNNSS